MVDFTHNSYYHNNDDHNKTLESIRELRPKQPMPTPPTTVRVWLLISPRQPHETTKTNKDSPRRLHHQTTTTEERREQQTTIPTKKRNEYDLMYPNLHEASYEQKHLKVLSMLYLLARRLESTPSPWTMEPRSSLR